MTVWWRACLVGAIMLPIAIVGLVLMAFWAVFMVVAIGFRWAAEECNGLTRRISIRTDVWTDGGAWRSERR